MLKLSDLTCGHFWPTSDTTNVALLNNTFVQAVHTPMPNAYDDVAINVENQFMKQN